MKIALITDTHWGIRNDNVNFHDNTKKFLEEVFFPYIDKNEVTKIIHLGDLVDRRKYVNFLTAKRLREDFLEPLWDRKLETHIIVGNHDVFYKNTNKVNSLKELVSGNYDNINVYIKPTEINLGGVDILLLPWINDENREEALNTINTAKSKVVMGHLELRGFEMFRGLSLIHI